MRLLFCMGIFCLMFILAVGSNNNRTTKFSVRRNSQFRLNPYNGKQKGRSELTLTSPTCHTWCSMYGNYCYCTSNRGNYAEDRKTTYGQAIVNCRIMGGDLASVHSKDEDAFLKSFAPQAMIGLRDVNGQFVWSDGSSVDYSGADPNFKNFAGYLGYCAQIGASYWENVECDFTEWYHVCKMPPTLYPNTECPDATIVHFDSGVLYSPGYPYYYYGSGSDCKYMIAAANGHKIEVTFERTYMANGNCISVYEGFNTDRLLGRPCGSYSTPFTYETASMNRMMLLFHTTVGSEGYWIISFRSYA